MNLKRLRTLFGVPAALIAVLVLALPGSAPAALGDQEEFITPTQPTKPLTLVEGPDGNTWYTNSEGTKIGKVTPSGEVTEYEPGLSGVAHSITSGPEGKLWFTEKVAKKIGSINTSGAGLTECSVAGEPEYIVEGSDGNLWFTVAPTVSTRKIFKMTPGCTVTEFSPGVTAGYNTGSLATTIITCGGDLWFGDVGPTKAVGKIDLPSETFTEFTITAGTGNNRPQSLACGGDGRVWFAAQGTEVPTEERIAAITSEGTVTYIPTGPALIGTLGLSFTGFATGADGNVWVKETAVQNERQKLTIQAGAEDLGGTYKLKFEGCETESLAFDASAAVIEEKLGALSCIGGVANVKGIEIPGGTGLLQERTIEFEGKLARTDVPMMECISELTGTTPTCSIAQIVAAVPQRLYRFKPSGEFDVFPLEPRTLTVTPATLGKMGTLVPGPGEDLWFTTAGDSKFGPEPGVTPAIGKFDLGIEPPVEGPELTIIKEGTGDGTVVSNPAGIECDPTCSAKFTENSKVTLTASPDSESLFVSWKGCDKVTEGEGLGVNGRQCTMEMDEAETVTAKFIKAHDVTVNRIGSGLGKVSSSPGGVLCLSNCSTTTAKFKEGISVTLKAAPSKNFLFTEWTGDCSGSELTCSLGALGENKEVGAKFTEVAKHLLTLTKSGGGNGTVKGKPAGINCGATCPTQAAAYYQGAVVELTATPGKGSSFGGWSGSGCSGTGTCLVTMSEAKAVTAEFK